MNKIYVARRRRNAIMMSLSFGATLVGLGWLVLILGVLLWEGFSGLSVAVFTEMTPPPGADGGLLNPGKVFPTLHRCAELGRMHVHKGELAFPDIPRF